MVVGSVPHKVARHVALLIGHSLPAVVSANQKHGVRMEVTGAGLGLWSVENVGQALRGRLRHLFGPKNGNKEKKAKRPEANPWRGQVV
jgi:hypothetical protein